MNDLLSSRRGAEPVSRYLEIGVAEGRTLPRVRADAAVGVDPFPKVLPDEIPESIKLHEEPSSGYFASDRPSREGPFDVVFVDGLHLWESALADVLHAFANLKRGGFVVVDDVLPSGAWEGERAASYADAVAQARAAGYPLISWMGDVWRAIYALTHGCQGSLGWATLHIKHDRYHTVFWKLSDYFNAASTDFDIEALSGLALNVPGETATQFRRRKIPSWYRAVPYRRFMNNLPVRSP